MFNFAWPWCFLLLPLPLIIYCWAKPANKTQTAVRVPFFDRLENANLNTAAVHRRRWWRLLTLCLIWLSIVAAAARPQWVGDAINLPQTGRDLLLAVDISESMNEKDMTVNNNAVTRLSVVKNVVADFIAQRQGDRLGLVLFGTNAYLQVPLTFDTTTVAEFLNSAQLGFAGPNTAIGEAIGLSVKRLQALQQDSNDSSERVIILLTDGANTAGEITPIQAAQLAAQLDIKIYTIGIGANEMIIDGFFGPRRVNPSAQLDEVTLRAIAQATNADYFRATSTDELNGIYEKINVLEPITQNEKRFRPTRSLFIWPLALGLLLALVFALMTLLHSTNSKPLFNKGFLP